MGEICAAKFYDDSCYYRAEISSIEGENVDVFFMDYGNFQKTEIEDLRPLPEVLKRVPKFAVEVNLTDIPNGTSLDAIAYYNKLTSSSIPLILVRVFTLISYYNILLINFLSDLLTFCTYVIAE